MNRKIILRKEIKLSSVQEKMIKSGCGDDVIESSVVESMTYISNGLKVNGYIAYPKDQSQKYPCVIWCRGGIGNAGAIDEFNARGILGQIASWGYAVFASQYRGTQLIAGQDFGSEGQDEFGGADINDVLSLIPLADEIECADKNLWAIEGWSRGGMMTYLVLAKTNIFKAAITIGGLANINWIANENKSMKRIFEYGMGNVVGSNFEDKCESRSIINFPDKLCLTTPILLIHGIDDDRIPASDSKEMAEALNKLNHPNKLVLVEGGDHFLKQYRN